MNRKTVYLRQSIPLRRATGDVWVGTWRGFHIEYDGKIAVASYFGDNVVLPRAAISVHSTQSAESPLQITGVSFSFASIVEMEIMP
jgi:hypothetical protein